MAARNSLRELYRETSAEKLMRQTEEKRMKPIDIKNFEADILLRLKDVLDIVSVGKTKWWQGVKDGHYPKPIYLGLRTPRWRYSDIHPLIEHGVKIDKNRNDESS